MHLATLPMQRVSAILNQVAFPAFARYQHDRELVAAQLLKALGMIGFFSFPVLWGMSSVARELVAVVLGSGWDAAVLPLQILTLVMPFRTLVGFLPSITDALGRPDVGLKNVILGCITMPLAFYVGTRWGIAGVALAWVVVYPFVLLVNVHRMLGVVGLRMALVAKKIAPSVLSAAGMYAAVYGMQRVCAEMPDRRVALLAEIGTGALVYGLLMLKFQMVMIGELKSMMFSRQAG
jgi:teichuronic acid exporter